MMGSPVTALLAAFVAILTWVGDARSGANASARAWLSWSAESTVLDASPGETGEVVLYPHVEGASDVAKVSNEILWSADIPTGAAMIWPEPLGDSVHGCGVTDGHPGRRGRITFAQPPQGDFCVGMRLRVTPPAATLGARFRRVVILEDSFGAADTLEIEEAGVTLNSGREAGLSFLVTGVAGKAPTAGGLADTVHVMGFGFENGTQAVLRAEGSGRTLSARTVNRRWTELTLEVSPGTGDSGEWRVVVENPSGVGYADSSATVEILQPPGGPRTWRVPENLARVREALEAAAPGDTVEVGAGLYENDHAWIVDKDRIVLRGAGADRTVVRGTDDSILAIVRSEGVEVTGIAFVVDNSGIPLRVPMQLADAGSSIESCVFVFENCRVCSFITQPRELRFVGNTVIRRGDGSNLFARVASSTRDGVELSSRVEIRRVLSTGFDASFACETPVAIAAACNWDAGRGLAWFETLSVEAPRLEDPDGLDFRPVEGSLALPQNNACEELIGAIGR